MPRKWDILEVCKDEKSCYYPGVAAWPCEGVQEEVSEAHSGGCDT
jgi:hypothetical protein